jgi:hypothetical protein
LDLCSWLNCALIVTLPSFVELKLSDYLPQLMKMRYPKPCRKSQRFLYLPI